MSGYGEVCRTDLPTTKFRLSQYKEWLGIHLHFHNHTPLVGVSFKGVEGSMETRSFLDPVESRLGSALAEAGSVAATKILCSWVKSNSICTYVHTTRHATFTRVRSIQ